VVQFHGARLAGVTNGPDWSSSKLAQSVFHRDACTNSPGLQAVGAFGYAVADGQEPQSRGGGLMSSNNAPGLWGNVGQFNERYWLA
jgi:hypothetical protein